MYILDAEEDVLNPLFFPPELPATFLIAVRVKDLQEENALRECVSSPNER